MRSRAWLPAVLVLLWGCGGGGMAEQDPENGFGGETSTGETATGETASGETGTPTQTNQTTETAPVAEVDTSGFEAQLTSALHEGWNPPNRDSSTPPRIAVVTVQLGPAGELESWSWRRRSPQGPFNDSIAEHMDEMVDSSRAFPLPPEGSDLHEQVLEDGMAIEFADE